jgi:hypothetical protein
MRVKSLGNNKTLVTLSNGNEIFVSYQTPVAACIDGVYYRTSKYWSKTTNKHISLWLDGDDAAEQPQNFFDQLMNT